MPTDATDAPTTFALAPKTVIADRFRVLRPQSGGSAYAITYLADDLTRGEPIVIKEFFPRSLVARATDGIAARPHSPESGRDFVRALRRFVIEGSVLSEIAHPHVVRARGLVEANGTAYLIMDQHQSQPLAEYVRAHGGRLTPQLAGRIVQHLLNALEPLHAESIVHRDLSPRSVHVQGDDSVLLLEFSARRHLPLHATDLASGFAAFEQYGMRDIGPWTDVYAASALLYYLLTGVVPPSALDRAAGEAVQSPTTLVPTLSPGLARLVLRGMSLLPQQRPHVASELRRQLEATLTEAAQPAPRVSPSAFPAEALSALHEMLPDADAPGALKLAAGGIVLPGEQRNAGLLRRLGSAASRFRRTPVVAPAPMVPDEEHFAPAPLQSERQPAPVAQASTAAAPVPAPSPVPSPAPSVPAEVSFAEPARPNPTIPTALVPVEERALPTVEERLRALDVAAQLALADVDRRRTRFGAFNKNRRYSLMAGGALIIVVASSLAFLRSSSASGNGVRTGSTRANASAAAPGGGAPAPTPAAPAHEIVEAGAVLQKAPHTDSSTVKTAAAQPKARLSEPAEHRAAPAPAPAPLPQGVLPSGKLPNVSVAIAGPSADIKIVTPEMLVDARTRLSRGQDAADQGDYAVARRAFRGALQQLDSLAARYPDSEKLRTLRHDVEQADRNALQACTAENDFRKRRGEQGKACQ